jgi:hypothetical protein
MAGVKLDGAGVQKMKTLEEANTQLAHLHAIVEKYALALKRTQPTSLYGLQIKRALTPLVGLLKGQFGLISDQVAALNLIAGRGGSETVKVRILREGVGQLRQALDIAAVRVRDHHTVKEAAAEDAKREGTPETEKVGEKQPPRH